MLPLLTKHSWGGDDIEIANAFQRVPGLRRIRLCTPEMWHIEHPKANWYSSVDGKSRLSSQNRLKAIQESAKRDYEADQSWKLPVPFRGGLEHLLHTNATSAYRCQRHKAGRFYGR
jgi:hypothetical protein